MDSGDRNTFVGHITSARKSGPNTSGSETDQFNIKSPGSFLFGMIKVVTLNQFIEKYNKRCIDFDKHYGCQCVDLFRQYTKDVLKLPQVPPVRAAKDIWYNYDKKSFTAHLYSSGKLPRPGDIMIWGEALGNTYGHIAIFVQGDRSGFTSFDQNWPEGSLPHLQGHSYNYILGWLRKRVIIKDMDWKKKYQDEKRAHEETLERANANYDKWQNEIDLRRRKEQELERLKKNQSEDTKLLRKIKGLVEHY